MAQLEDQSLETQILNILKERQMTAFELDNYFATRPSCPDNMALLLSKIRKKGLIHGEFSEEKGAWIYWADKEQ